MTDRIILFATNGRATCRGIRQVSEARFMAYQRDDDNLKYTLDYEAWLDGGTISTVTRELSGTSATSTSATTLQAIQKLTGQGYMDIKVLDSNGNTKQARIVIAPRTEDCDDLDERYP